MNDRISLELTNVEALVLFDWIKRFNVNELDQFEDQAEQRVLWDIEAQLERILITPLGTDYKNLLIQARNRIRDKE
ncbi:MAG: hypothetical protein ACYC4D_06660 [Thermoleophilia bacterium]